MKESKGSELLEMIASNIKSARKARGLTQEQVSGDSMAVRYYQKIESGRYWFTLKTLVKVAENLGINPVYLLYPSQKGGEMSTERRHQLIREILKSIEAPVEPLNGDTRVYLSFLNRKPEKVSYDQEHSITINYNYLTFFHQCVLVDTIVRAEKQGLDITVIS